MRGTIGLFALAALLPALAGIAQAADATRGPGAQDTMMIGRWVNPRNTLAVQTAPCADGGLCGAIVWASDQAQADAREAGVTALIGTQLLQGYRRVGSDWQGRVYVPDMGRSFSSHICQTSPETLTISGCLVGGFLCKSQTWHRAA